MRYRLFARIFYQCSIVVDFLLSKFRPQKFLFFFQFNWKRKLTIIPFSKSIIKVGSLLNLNMEQSCPQEIDQQLYITQGIKFKNQPLNPPSYKIARQRSASPLIIKDRNQSPHTKNFKEKHLMYKKDLLQQKFQNLQLNHKQQKKPMKLKLERINKENMMVLKQLGDISTGLQIKFEAQNSLLRRSLQKIERLVTRNNTQMSREKVQTSKYFQQKSKLQKSKLDISPTYNQKNLQTQLENEISQKNKLQEEIKGIKSINLFLTNENYKLSIEISMLKQRILEYEQNDYENALRTGNDISSRNSQSDESQKGKKEENSSKMEEIKQQIQKSDNEFLNIEKLDIHQIQSQDNIISHKSVESQKRITSLSKQVEESFSEKPNEVVQQCLKCQRKSSAADEIVRLIGQINNLQEELEQQKMLNESLLSRVSALKLQLSLTVPVKIPTSNQNNSNTLNEIDQKLDTAISINMDIKRNKEKIQHSGSQEDFTSQYLDKYPGQDQILNSAALTYPHKATKSHISNQIIYFAEPIGSSDEKIFQKSNKRLQKYQENSTKQPSIRVISRNQQEKQHEIDEISDSSELKSTSGIKKLQVPNSEIEKRRKSITEKMRNSAQGKSISLGNNSLSFYSNQKVNMLQIIRETISLKFEAFKYTFELFQNQMIMWPNGKLNTKESKSILNEYPFFLDNHVIQTLLGYCGAAEDKDIKVDKFCNKLKEFIQEYDEMSEEEELILEKKIYKRWKYTKDEVLEVMKKFQSSAGQITKPKFVAVLEQFKFQEKEIHHLLSQSVAISSDINHIKYRQYLANFLTKK